MHYLFYDVFTDRALLGNQLAVFPDARGLTTEQMQAITREINFSESTFILPAERPDTDIRMRIFTPAVEMPMAGHPTVGSTFALAHLGAIPVGTRRFVFGLNVGPTPVDLEWDDDRMAFAWMSATGEPPTVSKDKPNSQSAFLQLLATINRDILKDEIKHRTDFRSHAFFAAKRVRSPRVAGKKTRP